MDNLNSQRDLDDFFCISMHRSLIAVWLDNLDTLGFIQSCLREPRGMCFICSSAGADWSVGGYVGGNCGRDSSPMN